MTAIIEAIWEAILAFAQWIFDLCKAIVLAVWDMQVDLFCFILDGLLGFVVAMLSAIDLGSLEGALDGWGGLPPEVYNVIGLIGLGHCFAIIGTAIGIRLVLQLIPFVRLGS